MSALVEARGLSLPGRLCETTLDICEGELICLVGPNGSGKTSLLHAIAGIGRPSGRVRIAGVELARSSASERPELLTFLPASRDLRWPLLARDLIALGGGRAIPAELELEPLLDRRIDQLSTGERSRVMIARALAPRPRLLLLDEPTANLDPLWQIRLMETLKAELDGSSRSAVVAMHDLDAARRYADRILVIDRGKIAAEGLDGPHVADIFGIVRADGEWRPLRPPADPRSSP